MFEDAGSTLGRLLRRWWVIALVTLLVVGLASWWASSEPVRYRATAMMVLGPNPTLEQAELLRVADLINNKAVVATYTDVLGSPKVVDAAKGSLGLSASARDRYTARVTSEPDSNVIRITVEGPRRATVEQFAQAMQDSSLAATSELYPLYALTSLQSGGVFSTRASLSLPRTLLLAVVIGGGLGILAALWVDAVLSSRPSARRQPAPAYASTTHDVPTGVPAVSETTHS